MSRNLKVVGLAIMAVLAMSAVMASSASATNFTAAKYPAAITGTQVGKHVFKMTGTVECTTATFSGTLTGPSETITINPVYTGCTAFGFAEAKVTGFGHYGEANKCDYLFNVNGSAALQCSGGADVTIDAGPCDVTMQAANNTNITKNTFTNTPANKVTVDTAVTNIHGTVSKTNFLCPFTAGTHTNGVYEGTTLLEGKNAGVTTAIDVN